MVVIEPRTLLDVIPRQYAHRETSAEFMLNNGYSFNFDFYDMYTSGKKFNHQREQDRLSLSGSASAGPCESLNKFSQNLTGEFTRGVVMYVLLHQHHVHSNGLKFKLSILGQIATLDANLFSICGNVLFWPELIKDPKLKEILLKSIVLTPEAYSQNYAQYFLQKFKDFVYQDADRVPIVEPLSGASLVN